MEHKVALFDLENTLSYCALAQHENGAFSPSLWTVIPRVLGPAAEKAEEETKQKWLRGEYSTGLAWAHDSVRVHQDYGLTRNLFEDILAMTKIFPGYDMLITRLRNAGVKTGIISGGFVAHADLVRKELGVDWAMASCEHHWDEQGLLRSWTLRECDYEQKVEHAAAYLNDLGVTPEQCLFVGDGANDVPMAKYAGLSIAVNANQTLVDVATRSFSGRDVAQQILSFLRL